MPVTPEDFCSSAKAIAELGTDEIHSRNVISRSYYACHNAAKTYLQSIYTNYDLISGPSHQKVIDLLENSNLAKLAMIMNSFRQERVYADYELNRKVNPTYARQMIKQAERVLGELSALSATDSATRQA